jgi:hypothetical protein
VKKERALVSSFPFTSNLEILALFSCHPLHLQFSLVPALSLLFFIYLIASLFDANTTGEALFWTKSNSEPVRFSLFQSTLFLVLRPQFSAFTSLFSSCVHLSALLHAIPYLLIPALILCLLVGFLRVSVSTKDSCIPLLDLFSLSIYCSTYLSTYSLPYPSCSATRIVIPPFCVAVVRHPPSSQNLFLFAISLSLRFLVVMKYPHTLQSHLDQNSFRRNPLTLATHLPLSRRYSTSRSSLHSIHLPTVVASHTHLPFHLLRPS